MEIPFEYLIPLLPKIVKWVIEKTKKNPTKKTRNKINNKMNGKSLIEYDRAIKIADKREDKEKVKKLKKESKTFLKQLTQSWKQRKKYWGTITVR